GHSITSSVIIFVVHLFYITARKAKRQAPVAADFDGPNTLALTLQFVRRKPRQIHVLGTLGLIEVRENQPQSFSVLRLNAGLAAGVVEAPALCGRSSESRGECSGLAPGSQSQWFANSLF